MKNLVRRGKDELHSTALPVQRSPVTACMSVQRDSLHVGSKCLAKGVLAPICSSVTKLTQARAPNTSADFVGHLEGTDNPGLTNLRSGAAKRFCGLS